MDLARKRFPRPSVDDLNEALDTSITFLVVREPFERLVSAYRNKMEDGRNTYYKLLGDQIVKKFRTIPLLKIVSLEINFVLQALTNELTGADWPYVQGVSTIRHSTL